MKTILFANIYNVLSEKVLLVTSRDLTNDTTACLVAAYTGKNGELTIPTMDAMLTTTPPFPPLCLPMCSIATRVQLTTAF